MYKLSNPSGINVLSLFDGISAGQIALKRAGIEVDNYYAAEIDKYAIKVTQANYPDTIQLGDVTKWREWDVDWSSIDLLIGGSPCQSFSMVGSKVAFDDPRGKLFFTYVDVLNRIRSLNPDVKFMLENVKMKKEFLAVISECLGVEPELINSAKLGVQNRERFYWANWNISQPEDRGLVLSDIIELDNDEPLRPCTEVNCKGDSLCLRVATADDIKGHDYNKRVYSLDGKCPTLAAASGGNLEPKILVSSGVYRKITISETEAIQNLPIGYTEGVSKTQRKKMIGNSWDVATVAHIFRCLKFNPLEV